MAKSLTFTDIGQSCPNREFLVSQICLLPLILAIKSEFIVLSWKRPIMSLGQTYPCETGLLLSKYKCKEIPECRHNNHECGETLFKRPIVLHLQTYLIFFHFMYRRNVCFNKYKIH